MATLKEIKEEISIDSPEEKESKKKTKKDKTN